jgi:allantoinase
MPNAIHAPEDLSRDLDFVLRGHRVITREGERPAAIHVRNGVIQAVSDYADVRLGTPIYEAGELAVMPGLVDTHVHINEPGRTDWEGFSTATRAAAAGGITTLIEMPLNSIPATTSTVAFQDKILASSGKLFVDTGFWGGLVPGNTSELRGLWDAGCFGFKCFLVNSGVAEFAHVSESDLRAGLPELSRLGAPLLVHAELQSPIDEAIGRLPADASGRSYKTWLFSRPRSSENDAIAMLLRLAAEYAAQVHIVHLSSAEAISQLKRAKSANLPVSVETCPHYLTFAAEQIPDGATQFKCAPPIREAENREQLWAGLADGTIDMIATDHSPCPPQMKELNIGDFMRAWGGIASLQLSLPAVWTEAKSRGYSLGNLAGWLCEGPAKLAGLATKKGRIAAGCDADFVLWNPEAKFLVDEDKLHHRHKLTPYHGRELAGRVVTTFLRGKKIFDNGEFIGAPFGQLLLRGQR